MALSFLSKAGLMPAAATALGLAAGAASPGRGAAFNRYSRALQNISQQYSPYVTQGTQSLTPLMGQTQQTLNRPWRLEDELARHFATSPFQQQTLRNITNQMNANAAISGTLGSTASNIALQNALAPLQMQWQNQYVGQGIDQYNQSIENLLRLATLGESALGGETDLEKESELGRFGAGTSPNIFSRMLSGGLSGLISAL